MYFPWSSAPRELRHVRIVVVVSSEGRRGTLDTRPHDEAQTRRVFHNHHSCSRVGDCSRDIDTTRGSSGGQGFPQRKAAVGSATYLVKLSKAAYLTPYDCSETPAPAGGVRPRCRVRASRCAARGRRVLQRDAKTVTRGRPSLWWGTRFAPPSMVAYTPMSVAAYKLLGCAGSRTASEFTRHVRDARAEETQPAAPASQSCSSSRRAGPGRGRHSRRTRPRRCWRWSMEERASYDGPAARVRRIRVRHGGGRHR